MAEGPGPDERSAEPRMLAARYHAQSGRVFVELTNGVSIAFPVELVQGLAGASVADLDAVTVTGDGYVLHWPGPDVYLSLLALLTDILGARVHMMRLAGQRGSRG